MKLQTKGLVAHCADEGVRKQFRSFGDGKSRKLTQTTQGSVTAAIELADARIFPQTQRFSSRDRVTDTPARVQNGVNTDYNGNIFYNGRRCETRCLSVEDSLHK